MVILFQTDQFSLCQLVNLLVAIKQSITSLHFTQSFQKHYILWLRSVLVPPTLLLPNFQVSIGIYWYLFVPPKISLPYFLPTIFFLNFPPTLFFPGKIFLPPLPWLLFQLHHTPNLPLHLLYRLLVSPTTAIASVKHLLQMCSKASSGSESTCPSLQTYFQQQTPLP